MGSASVFPHGWLGDESFPDDPRCSCGLGVALLESHQPGCDRALQPYLDEDSLVLVEQAVESLMCVRGSGVGDTGAALSALASLIAEAQARLPDAVADAREGDCSWAEIAARVASTASSVRRRYGPYARWRAGQVVLD